MPTGRYEMGGEIISWPVPRTAKNGYDCIIAKPKMNDFKTADRPQSKGKHVSKYEY
jgi:hypothetical protein